MDLIESISRKFVIFNIYIYIMCVYICVCVTHQRQQSLGRLQQTLDPKWEYRA